MSILIFYFILWILITLVIRLLAKGESKRERELIAKLNSATCPTKHPKEYSSYWREPNQSRKADFTATHALREQPRTKIYQIIWTQNSITWPTRKQLIKRQMKKWKQDNIRRVFLLLQSTQPKFENHKMNITNLYKSMHNYLLNMSPGK